MLEIAALPGLHGEAAEAVHALLVEVDEEFVPPLSARTSTHQSSLSGCEGAGPSGVSAYFGELLAQPCLLAEEEGRLCGFLSYIERYELPWLDVPCVYITTVASAPAHRGEGVASALYSMIEKRAGTRPVLLRTWSTNAAQISLLEKRGYMLVRRERNGRGRGIDTLYFMKGTEA